jgi:hypothetical protein
VRNLLQVFFFLVSASAHFVKCCSRRSPCRHCHGIFWKTKNVLTVLTATEKSTRQHQPSSPRRLISRREGDLASR